MTDSEKIAAPAEQPAASEKPMSAAADAVETPSEPAPEKKPRRPRRKKPAVEQATLELSAPENAVPAQPVEEQSVSAPPTPEAPARKRPAPKQSAAKTARKQSEQPKQPVEAPVEPKQPEQPVLTEHPVQIPAVAASVLPAEAVASAVPAVSEPAAVPAVASPEESAAADASETAEGRCRRTREAPPFPPQRSGAAAVPPKAMPPLTQPRRKRVKRPIFDEPVAADAPAEGFAESAPVVEDEPAGAESGQESAATAKRLPANPAPVPAAANPRVPPPNRLRRR